MGERTIDGIRLCTDFKTSTDIVATETGVYLAGRVIRKAPSDRWSRTAIGAIKGCPQEPAPGWKIPNFVWPERQGGDSAGPPADTVTVIPADVRVLPTYIRKHDVTMFGRTPGCEGCRHVVLERAQVPEQGINSAAGEVAGDVGVTMLVVKDFLHKSIWVYPVEGQGATMAEWLPGMIRADMATCGMDNSMLIVKTD